MQFYFYHNKEFQMKFEIPTSARVVDSPEVMRTIANQLPAGSPICIVFDGNQEKMNVMTENVLLRFEQDFYDIVELSLSNMPIFGVAVLKTDVYRSQGGFLVCSSLLGSQHLAYDSTVSWQRYVYFNKLCLIFTTLNVSVPRNLSDADLRIDRTVNSLTFQQ